VDLLTGIVTGLALSAVKLIIVMTRLQIRTEKAPAGGRIDLHLSGAGTFLRLPRIADALDALPSDGEVHIHFRGLDYVDHAVLDLIQEWRAQRIQKGQTVYVEVEELITMYHDKNRLGLARKAA
jgi:MFS superfamily sulfate permease-like transporter